MPARITFAVLLSLMIFPGRSFALEPGDAIPEFSLATESGANISAADYRGKVLLIDFWASWCQACAKSLKGLENLQKEYGQKGLQVITVNLDEDRQDALKILKKTGVQLLVGFDARGISAENFNVLSMPSAFVVNRDGRLVSIHEGAKDSEKERMKRSVLEVLGE